MGYRTTVRSNVQKAFNILKDLAINVTFSRSTVTEFDFATNAAVATVIPPVIVKAILINKARKPDSEQSGTSSTSLLMKVEDISDPTIYDRITMPDGSVWRIVTPCSNDGYTITVEIRKEGL